MDLCNLVSFKFGSGPCQGAISFCNAAAHWEIKRKTPEGCTRGCFPIFGIATLSGLVTARATLGCIWF